MIRLLAVIERDLKKFRRNPVVIAMSVLMPILYLVILGSSFQGKLKGLPIVVVNQDSGPYSKRIVENLRAVEAGPGTLQVLQMQNQTEAIKGVREGLYKAALIIPADFSKRMSLKGSPETGLFLDNTDGISSETIKNVVESAIRPIKQAVKSEYISIRERAGEAALRGIELYPKIDYYQSLVPGVVIMAIFLGAMTTGAFNLVMDRFLGVDESYLLTPLSKAHIVTGLITSGLFITTLIAAFILAVSMLITGIPFSKGIAQCFSIFVVITLTTLSLLSLMFVLLGRINHPRVVGILSGFLNVMLFFPSGAVYPVASFPGWLKAFAKVNPEAHAVEALKAILFKGAGITNISGEIFFLLAFTIFMLTTAIISFKRRL